MKKIIAAKAHIANQDTEVRTYSVAAEKLNASQRFRPLENRRNVSERLGTRMKVFIQMRNADGRASGVANEPSESEFLLEETKTQMAAVESLKHVEQEKEMEQRCKKENARKQILAPANEKSQQSYDSDKGNDDRTPGGLTHHYIQPPLIDVGNCLETFNGSTERSVTAKLTSE